MCAARWTGSAIFSLATDNGGVLGATGEGDWQERQRRVV